MMSGRREELAFKEIILQKLHDAIACKSTSITFSNPSV
jgi:hypothetical protein